MMQFGANPLTAFGMPNMMTMMGGYVGLPMATTTISAASTLTSNSAAAAIVQKINQVEISYCFIWTLVMYLLSLYHYVKSFAQPVCALLQELGLTTISLMNLAFVLPRF